mmetsp:Transcript_16198/g.24295  ORF Transcript_16198/g.24295 Transcript_16198/m.24295 type:complete len:355 (+) Transcript_16198:312-1376(+)
MIPYIYIVYSQLRNINSSGLVGIVNNSNITGTSHDNRTLAMNSIGGKLQNSSYLTIEKTSGGNSSGLLNNHGHRDTLIKATKLSLSILVISGVKVDSSVQQSTVDIGNHRSYITGTVWLLSSLEGQYGILDGLIPEIVVTLVGRVDTLSTIIGESHVITGMYEFSNGRIKAESLNSTSTEGEYKLHSRGVNTVSGTDAVSTGFEKVIDTSLLGSRGSLIYGENGSDRNITVNIGGSVEGIKCYTVFTGLILRNDDGIFILLGNKDGTYTTVDKGIDHHIIGHNIELLLVISGGIDLSGESVKLGYSGAVDGGGNDFEGSGKGVHKDDKIRIAALLHYITAEGGGIDIDNITHIE